MRPARYFWICRAWIPLIIAKFNNRITTFVQRTPSMLYCFHARFIKRPPNSRPSPEMPLYTKKMSTKAKRDSTQLLRIKHHHVLINVVVELIVNDLKRGGSEAIHLMIPIAELFSRKTLLLCLALRLVTLNISQTPG